MNAQAHATAIVRAMVCQKCTHALSMHYSDGTGEGFERRRCEYHGCDCGRR